MIRSLTLIAISILLTPQRASAGQVSFAGLEIDAKSVVFVCDGSRWSKNKIEDLEDELTKSIDAMSSEQQVSVIFFADDRAYGPADGKLLPATDDNKRTLKDWLKHVDLGDRPTPIAGFARAFASKPEAIVLVTDGKFADDYDDVAKDVAKRNAGRAVHVHAVGFFRTEKEDDSRRFVDFMKKLAEDNGGQFKEAYVDELRRKR
jgi:hypothetical protein